MDGWDVDTPKSSLLPHLPTTMLYGLFFGLGWLLHRQPRLLAEFARDWRVPMVVGLLTVLPASSVVGWLRELGFPPGSTPWVRWVYSSLYALMMWGLVLGFLGLFIRFFHAESPAWRYVADSSYWIYLVHLPLVVWLQILVARWPVHWTVKWPLIIAAAAPILFLSYHYFVRFTFIGVQLNGRKYPRHPAG
jgi:peptidoglycan/LPS O-acetylase OafA/YrhL